MVDVPQLRIDKAEAALSPDQPRDGAIGRLERRVCRTADERPAVERRRRPGRHRSKRKTKLLKS